MQEFISVNDLQASIAQQNPAWLHMPVRIIPGASFSTVLGWECDGTVIWIGTMSQTPPAFKAGS
jgi:hypothetical protein